MTQHNDSPNAGSGEIPTTPVPPVQTFGEEAVRFSETEQPLAVRAVKRHFVHLIDRAFNAPTTSYLEATLRGEAIRSLIAACNAMVDLETRQ